MNEAAGGDYSDTAAPFISVRAPLTDVDVGRKLRNDAVEAGQDAAVDVEVGGVACFC